MNSQTFPRRSRLRRPGGGGVKLKPAYFVVKLGASGQTVTKPGGFTEREAGEYAAASQATSSSPSMLSGRFRLTYSGGGA